MKAADHVAWFRRAWITTNARLRVMGEYAALARSPHLLSDIAQRGGVFRAAHVPGDPYTTAWNDGRRSLAIEIIEMAGCDPRTLLDIVERRPRTELGERT